MSTLKYILLGCVLTFSFQSLAQIEKTSGYLGKRLSVGYALDVSLSEQPQVSNPTSLVSSSTSKLGVNKMWSGHIDYAVRNNLQLGLSLGSFKTSVALNKENVYWGEQFNYNLYEYELQQVFGTPDISVSTIGASLKWFPSRKGGIAPLGSYIGVGLTMHRAVLDFNNVEYLVEENRGFHFSENFMANHSNPINRATYLELNIKYGKVWPIGKKVLVECSASCGLMSSLLINLLDDDLSGYNSPAESSLVQTRTRLARANILKTGISLSYLIL